MTKDESGIDDHPVVGHDGWLAARTAFLAKEKEFTRFRDAINRERRELPWERIETPYVFEGPSGQVSLPELFDGRHQLIVYHFMFDPSWDEGCPHCSFWADNFDGIAVHLNHRDTSFAAIARAPLAKIGPFKARMGWAFDWFSSSGSDFNYDFGASFTPEQIGTAVYNFGTMDPEGEDREGTSVFYRDDEGRVFRTYSTYARGIDLVNGMYNFLDLTPKGRDEDGLEGVQAWVRYHDRYED